MTQTWKITNVRNFSMIHNEALRVQRFQNIPAFLKLMKRAFTSSYQVMRPSPLLIGERSHMSSLRAKGCIPSHVYKNAHYLAPRRTPGTDFKFMTCNRERSNKRGPPCNMEVGGRGGVPSHWRELKG